MVYFWEFRPGVRIEAVRAWAEEAGRIADLSGLPVATRLACTPDSVRLEVTDTRRNVRGKSIVLVDLARGQDPGPAGWHYSADVNGKMELYLTAVLWRMLRNFAGKGEAWAWADDEQEHVRGYFGEPFRGGRNLAWKLLPMQ